MISGDSFLINLIIDTINTFSYCNNNPLTFIDKDGLSSKWYDKAKSNGDLHDAFWSLNWLTILKHKGLGVYTAVSTIDANRQSISDAENANTMRVGDVAYLCEEPAATLLSV